MVGGGTGGIAGSGVPTMSTSFTCTPQTWDTAPIGWATQSGGTTGGGTGTPMMVTSLSALNTAAGGTTARVIQFTGKLSGTVTVGSNKTILGGCGAEIDGHIQMSGSSNVIMRNVKVVGLNCTDNSDCQSGLDGITVDSKSSHLWFDHLDVSNGSDGNLDITQQSDFVTVSWTKFSYSGQRAGGHQFSNLIGASDTDTSDTGHLRVTWHHDWWGANVGERMPRARFGQVHVFDSLYTATGDNACIEVGVSANMLIENNVFMNVSDPIDTLDYSDGNSVAVTRNNIFTAISGMFVGRGTGGFTPPYTYNLDGGDVVAAEVMSGSGVK
jgi:pectate lyase